ncbi:Aspercryptin biosynthesis cluster-specific transcription regulator atnN [Colletotrichum fructicola]|nr:Aspercryptin biosynthesis cluster-specific transcription regulator atnN [Colletotrichum fructicola]
MPLDAHIPGTGVFSVAPAPKKPKRTRASASKVRTGCLTCKVRHVKCDEEKPTCKRCKKDKHKCDGYPNLNAVQTRRASRSPSANATATACMLARQIRNTSVMHLTAPVNWDITGDNIERLMFHHVHNCTVPDFGASTPLAKLWSNYILPLGYYSDSVKHAVIALGSAHRAFLENPFYETQATESSLELSDVSIRHYRKAVSEAIQIMADPSPVNIRITLISCLVFVCYEIIRGQYDKAVQHLRSGAKVLDSLHQATLAYRRNPASLSAYDKCLAETVENHFIQLCDIAGMFSCMGMDASMLIEEDVVPDLSFFVQDEEKDQTRPFTSVAEARYQLHLVEVMFSEAFDESWVSCSEGSTCRSCPSPPENGKDSPGSTTSRSSTKQAEWDLADKHFKEWCVRFDAFQEGLPERIDPADKEELKALDFSRKSWEIFNSHDTPCDMKHSDMGVLNELVDMAEDIILGKTQGTRPTFSLAADVVPSLSYICAFCENDDLERRCIDALRRMKRREGMWDSQEMANLYDFILQAKSDNTWKDEYNWESLPNLARRMNNLSISSSGREGSPTPSSMLSLL